jgi:hypothetical protein
VVPFAACTSGPLERTKGRRGARPSSGPYERFFQRVSSWSTRRPGGFPSGCRGLAGDPAHSVAVEPSRRCSGATRCIACAA